MKHLLKGILKMLWSVWARLAQNRINIHRNKVNADRKLEFGSSTGRRQGFETADVVAGRSIDYVLDCTRRLPFANDTFSLVYASHVIEHLPWYSVCDILTEWVRVLRPGGRLELWVPDGLKVCQSVLAAEEGKLAGCPDGWAMLNPANDPFLWANGRLFYGANPNYPSWHKAMYTPKSLVAVMQSLGLKDVRLLEASENSGPDNHGWINLGACGFKR